MANYFFPKLSYVAAGAISKHSRNPQDQPLDPANNKLAQLETLVR